eukprot:gene4732-4910_t
MPTRRALTQSTGDPKGSRYIPDTPSSPGDSPPSRSAMPQQGTVEFAGLGARRDSMRNPKLEEHRPWHHGPGAARGRPAATPMGTFCTTAHPCMFDQACPDSPAVTWSSSSVAHYPVGAAAQDLQSGLTAAL